jgi:hypothetical protein
MKAAARRGTSPSEELLPFQFRDEFGDVVPCLKPSRCPCDSPCQRVLLGRYPLNTDARSETEQ